MAAKILIIEDQHAFMLRSLLELYGDFEFEIAQDGSEATQKLAGELPNLILLDLRLPHVGGLLVLDRVRQIDSRLPVIVVSAYGDKRTRQEAATRGATAFFQKPVSTMRLYQRIKELLATAPVLSRVEGPRRNNHDTLILKGNQAEQLAKHRRLLKLKERRALLGIDAPPELLIEIEDLEGELTDVYS